MGNENDKNDQLADLKPKGCCNDFSLYISNGKIDPSDVTCSICYTIFASPRVIKCKHVFCQECINEWGKMNTVSCPLCRVESKRTRGSFGRADKRLQNKISKLFLKCRNCCWTGSYCQFLTQYAIQPYLEDKVVPCEKKNEQKEDNQREDVVQQKVQAKEILVETQKQEEIKNKQQQDQVVEVKRNKQKNFYELFVEQVFAADHIEPQSSSSIDQIIEEDRRVQYQVEYIAELEGNQ